MNNVIATENELNTFYEIWKDLSERAAKIATAIRDLELADKGSFRSSPVFDSDDISIYEGQLYCEYDESLGCGEYENHSLLIPDSYLFDENFLEEAKKRIEERKIKAADERKREQEHQKKCANERERAQYLKLKKKFG